MNVTKLKIGSRPERGIACPDDRTSTDPGSRRDLRVRTNLHAGIWQCTSCQGQVMGDQLFRPTCSFCQDV